MGSTRRPSTSRPGSRRTALFVAVTTILQLTLLTGPAAAACHVAAFSPGSVEVEQTAGEVTLTVVLQGGQPGCEGTVDYATEDGTAVAGEDYEAASGTLTFSAGDDREEDITIVLLADGASEASREFQVVLSNPTGSISGTGDPATVTITGAQGVDEPTDEPATDEPATDEPATDAPTGEPEPVEEDGFPWVPVVVVLLVLVGAGVAFAVRGNRPAS